MRGRMCILSVSMPVSPMHVWVYRVGHTYMCVLTCLPWLSVPCGNHTHLTCAPCPASPQPSYCPVLCCCRDVHRLMACTGQEVQACAQIYAGNTHKSQYDW